MKGKPSAQKNAPLRGVRVLVGRARHQAGALSAKLREQGAQVIEIPFIEIRPPRSFRPLDVALQNLSTYDWLILTSVNGVEAMWDRLKKLRLTAEGKRLRVAAIGPATKKAIAERGLKVDVVPKEYIAESVVRSLKRRVQGKRILLVRAKVARDVIPLELRKAGASVDVIEAYETVVPQSSRSELRRLFRNPGLRPHVVTFTSSSTVRNFVELLRSPSRTKQRALAIRTLLDGVKMASIGPVTSATLRDRGLLVDIRAREYTIPGLVKAIAAALRH